MQQSPKTTRMQNSYWVNCDRLVSMTRFAVCRTAAAPVSCTVPGGIHIFLFPPHRARSPARTVAVAGL